MEILHNLELQRLRAEADGRLHIKKQRILLSESSSIAPQDASLLLRECEKLRTELEDLSTRHLDDYEDLE